MILLEIEDPKTTGGFPVFLNKYLYTGFLKDVGGAYMTITELESFIKTVFKDVADIEFLKFRNIIGCYMIAKIVKKKEFNHV